MIAESVLTDATMVETIQEFLKRVGSDFSDVGHSGCRCLVCPEKKRAGLCNCCESTRIDIKFPTPDLFELAPEEAIELAEQQKLRDQSRQSKRERKLDELGVMLAKVAYEVSAQTLLHASDSGTPAIRWPALVDIHGPYATQWFELGREYAPQILRLLESIDANE